MTNRRVRKHIHTAVRYYTIEGGEGGKEREEWSGGRTGAALGGVGLELLVLVVEMDVVDDFWELSSATYFETRYVLRGEQTCLDLGSVLDTNPAPLPGGGSVSGRAIPLVVGGGCVPNQIDSVPQADCDRTSVLVGRGDVVVGVCFSIGADCDTIETPVNPLDEPALSYNI